MNSAIFRRHTRKSYGGSIQNELKQQENILKKLQANLKWKNVRQITITQREQLPQKVANQQKKVNDLRKLAATSKQNSRILETITNKLQQAATTVQTAVQRNNSATTKSALNQNQLNSIANGYAKLANGLRKVKGGSRRIRHKTHRK